MNRAQAVKLVQFNAWANRRIFRKAARLPLRILRGKTSLSYPSPLATLVHILDVQWYWREAAQSGRLPSATLRPSDFPRLQSLRRRWDEEDDLFLEFVRSRTDRQLLAPVTYSWPQARPRKRPLWHLLMHVVNHGTQHRSELALFLTSRQLSPGNMDFLDFIRSRAGAAD
ncbi:MAG: DinB family protein [Anaerolineales bacterium]